MRLDGTGAWARPGRDPGDEDRERGHGDVRAGRRRLPDDCDETVDPWRGRRDRRRRLPGSGRGCEGELPCLAGAPGQRRRVAGRVALVEAPEDPPGGELAEVAAHRAIGRRGSLDVVLRAPEAEVAVARRPGGSDIAVQGHPHAAGIEQIGAVRARTPELLVAVAEDDRPVVLTRKQPPLPLLGLWREALVVGKR